MGWPYETLQGRLPHLNELPHPPGVPLLHASSFWDHSQLKYRAQNYPRLMLTCQKGKNDRETTENRQRIVLKRFVKRKWEARNIHPKREVSGQIKRVGISAWNLCWSALGVAQGETSAGLWWFCYHSCTSVALTTSKVLVTCVTTYRTDLRDNTRGLRNNQCTVATWHMHLLGVYSRFQVTGMIKGIFWVWNFRFQIFWGYENLASIYISWRLISVNKVQPKKVHVVI